MNRRDADRAGGRRPLLSTFDGNNRQMLNEIRDSLSHLRNNELEGYPSDLSGFHLKQDVQPQTPGLPDKRSKVNRLDNQNQHHQAMAEIRASLRPYQNPSQINGVAGSNGHSSEPPTGNSSSIQNTESFHNVQALMNHGFDEDIAVRALKLSGNQGLEPALVLLNRIIEELKQREANNRLVSTGATGYLNHRPSYGPSSPSASESNSVRSDSPSLNPGIPTNLVNGLQEPPPLPPRAPISTGSQSIARGQTPPTALPDSYKPHQSVVGQMISQNQLNKYQATVAPRQITNQNKAQILQQQQPYYQALSKHHQIPSVKTSTSDTKPGFIGQRGVSPITAFAPPFHHQPPTQQAIMCPPSSAGSTPAPSPLPYQQIQNLNIGPRSSPTPSSPSSISSTSTGPSLQQTFPNPPPPYSQAVPSTRRAIYNYHVPLIMNSVHSKEVKKPVPQTATAPLPPTISGAGYLPQSHVNNRTPLQDLLQQHLSNGDIPLPSRPLPDHRDKYQISHSQPNSQIVRNGGVNVNLPASSITPDQLPAAAFAQKQQWNRHTPYTSNIHNKLPNGVYYPGLNESTPRSDSPVSRATNQSPLSVVSNTSSPSTNSDVPEKPPPPYPGRGVIGHPPPRIPPRVPLKQGEVEQQQPPPQYSQVPLASSSSSASPSSPIAPVVSNGPSILPAPAATNIIPPVKELVNQPGPQVAIASETDETDTDASSIDQGQANGVKTNQEIHRCTSPLPKRKSEAKERDRYETKVRMYSPQAFKFYMEQHVENVIKSYTQRINRRQQLEREMTKVNLSEEAARQMRKMLYQKESNYIRLKRAKMDSSMFEKIQTLGVGAFGEVALVRKKDMKTLFAMKTLKKSNVIKRNQVAHVKAERDILAEADNEWVVKLYYSFQDRDNLYFVMDYVPGGDLMGLLIRKEILEETLAQFYIAELVLAIESVHRMGFIHRDIKPDNILIDKEGHIKLTDFGLCTGFRWTHNSKYYQKGGHDRQDSMNVGCQMDGDCNCEILKPLEQRREREQKRCLAHSLVGTPNYIAPEVLLRLGYTKACDWWSVGVILYEMVIGQPPFYANTPADTQKRVINWRETLNIPQHSNISTSTCDLIRKFLQDPEDRLGAKGTTEVKHHPFFSRLNLDNLRRQPAPFKPQIKFLMDTSNFDPVDTDKLRTDSDTSKKHDSKHENGKHPEHEFFEFTFRRFFDDGGHPCSLPTTQEQENNSPVYV